MYVAHRRCISVLRLVQIECLDVPIAVNFVGTSYCGTTLVRDVADGDLPLVNNIKVSHSIDYVIQPAINCLFNSGNPFLSVCLHGLRSV